MLIEFRDELGLYPTDLDSELVIFFTIQPLDMEPYIGYYKLRIFCVESKLIIAINILLMISLYLCWF
jgi:hypothetical protein